MRIIRRALLSLLRSPARTGAVVAILAISLGLALTMSEVHAATAGQLGSISGQVGTEIEVRPAGFFGLQGGGEPLAPEQVDKLNDIPHVVSVQESTTTQYAGDSLVSGINAGTLGALFEGSGGTTQDNMPAMPTNTPNFRINIGIQIMGLDPANQTPTLTGGGTLTIEQGRYFTTDESDADVVVVGQALAEANSLEVGSTIDIEGTPVEVIGTFSSGQRFGDNMLLMPTDTVQRLYNLGGATSVTVVADDVSNVDAVVSGIREIFDENTADIVTAQDMYARIGGSISSASSASETGMIVSFIVAGAVILLSVLLTVRQRIREIGILKAVGASNGQIGFQFGLETLVVSLVAAIVGACLTLIMAQNVANMFVNSSSPAGGGMFGGGGMRIISGSIGGVQVAVSPEIFLIALGAALVLAVAASTIPVWYIARVRPAEVLRNE